jgi:hypothetical protein
MFKRLRQIAILAAALEPKLDEFIVRYLEPANPTVIPA